MKRLWIGLTVLAVLLASGCTVTLFMEHCHKPISTDLAQAAEAALADDWTRATELAHSVQARWLRCRSFTAAFADHTVLEEMNCLFAEIEVYATARETLAFASVCARLSQLADAIANSHRPAWENLL